MADKGKLKGKNFSVDEERQLCKSYINISEDPMVGTGQRAKTFWERVSAHYMQHLPDVSRSERSLESKFGDIKTDVAKFVGVHASVEALNESGTTQEDVLEKSHELFKVKNKRAFKYAHCWEILRTVPKYCTYRDEEKVSSNKRRSLGSVKESIFLPELGFECSGVKDHMAETESTRGAGLSFAARPKGAKTAKLESKLMAQSEIAKKAQAKAIENLAAANFEKNVILRHQQALLQQQQVLALFSIPTEGVTDDVFKEYLLLRRAEELKKLKQRLQMAVTDDIPVMSIPVNPIADQVNVSEVAEDITVSNFHPSSTISDEDVEPQASNMVVGDSQGFLREMHDICGHC